MPPLGFVFLANGGNLTEAKLYATVRQRLRTEPGCHDVRVRPSRASPRTIAARVQPAAFLRRAYAVDDATLEVELSSPRSVDDEYYVIQWSEPEREFGLGWHRDETHPDLGECHVQIDHAETTLDRTSATFVDEHPMNVLEVRLDQLRTVLPRFDWESGVPTLSENGLSALELGPFRLPWSNWRLGSCRFRTGS